MSGHIEESTSGNQAMTDETRSPPRTPLFSSVWLVAGATRLIGALPVTIAEAVVAAAIQSVMFFLPRYKRIGLVNLRIAFPEKDDVWRLKVYKKSLRSLARLIVDFARLPRLDPDWVMQHVEGDWVRDYRALKREFPGQGILIATGHLGSFELLAHSMPMAGHPISFVARSFEWKALDNWWKQSRERYGNQVINRRGAFRDVIQLLSAGRDVALLFDQNLTANHAAFVPWFGKEAATTKTLAIAALRLQCPVVVVGILTLPGDRYRTLHEVCDYRELYADSTRSVDEKVFLITKDLASRYEKMIRAQPEGWFWMHRRWRTRPPHDLGNPYAGC